VGLARGKRQYDKRESIKKRETTREIQRATGRR
jgi:tmRNA-binding protein